MIFKNDPAQVIPAPGPLPDLLPHAKTTTRGTPDAAVDNLF